MPAYSGKVLVHGSNGDELSVPYFGVGGNINRELRDSLWHQRYPYAWSTNNFEQLETKSWFVVPLDDVNNHLEADADCR